MEHTFLTEINIIDVRHLHHIKIPLSRTQRKHLILTGKNGSGKTSVLKGLTAFLQYLVSDDYEQDDSKVRIAELKDKLHGDKSADRITIHRQIKSIEANARRRWNDGCVVSVNSPLTMRERYKKGQFILAYYRDNRQLDLGLNADYSKVELKSVYGLEEHPASNIGKYLLNLKTTQAFAKLKMDDVDTDAQEVAALTKRIQDIDNWFERFTKVLRDIYNDDSLKLKFDINTQQFAIILPDRDPFALDCMSMGYAAIFDIVGDLMMRMESQHSYELEGVVLIDEIETHLHVELQRAIVPILMELFPNLQFILTTHSPFILNSMPNSVVYDLENNFYLEDGLAHYSYEGIVEGYFDADLHSEDLRQKLIQYKELVHSENIEANLAEIAKLERYLDQVPTYLSVDFGVAYRELKREARRKVEA